MKKTNKVKMGPLGTPLGNALGYFNSLKSKRTAEPKQTLRKAQEGGRTAGPFDENTSKYLDARYPGTALKFQGPVDPNYEAEQREKVADTRGATTWGSQADLEKRLRNDEESVMRSQGWRDDFNAGPMKTAEDVENAPYYKKGGSTKSKMKTSGSVKKMQDGGIFTPHGRLKSKKTRDISLSSSGNSTNVSRTKRNGDIVTKSINTSNGYGGTTADKTKTITNKAGETVSKKTKNISAKSADRKINRVSNNVGRNANDTWAYKKGGLVKKKK
jgi:hypothetical protein